MVLSMGKGTIGVVADRTREILRVDADVIDPAPALLTRGAGDAEITSICRLEHGKRLVAVLSPDRLFRSDVVSRLLSEQDVKAMRLTIKRMDMPWPTSSLSSSAWANRSTDCHRCGDEIARPPDRSHGCPRRPAFVDGVMNLRGIVVPDHRSSATIRDVARRNLSGAPAHSRAGGWRREDGFHGRRLYRKSCSVPAGAFVRRRRCRPSRCA